MPNIQSPGEVPGLNVDDSQGIVIGTGNKQYNIYASRPPLDPTAIGAVNPHIAVVRLQQLSHDDLVDFFAKASPADVSEILEVFIHADEPKIVAALGDISFRKANELIGSSGAREFLAELPVKTEAINRKAASLKWHGAGPLEVFGSAYVRKYKNGHVFATASRAWVTTGKIDIYWAANVNTLGIAIDDLEPAPTSPFGTRGIRQEFQKGAVYSSERYGPHRILDESCHEGKGGSEGWLGFPVSERQCDKQFGERQIFEGGAIYSHIVDGPEGLNHFAVSKEALAFLARNPTWRPASDEALIVSALGTQGTVQHFEIQCSSGTRETVAYTLSRRRGPLKVDPMIWDYYNNLGAEKSWLGFPVGETNESFPESQEFEAGKISWINMNKVLSEDYLGEYSGESDRATYESIDVVPLDPDRFLSPLDSWERSKVSKPEEDV